MDKYQPVMLFIRTIQLLWLISITLLLDAQFAQAAIIFPIGSDWGRTVQLTFQDPLVPPGPLSILSDIDRSIGLRNFKAEPFTSEGPDGSIKFDGESTAINLSWPMLWDKSTVVIKFGLDNSKYHATSERANSLAILTDKEDGTTFKIANYWEPLSIRWGVAFHWVTVGGITRFAPDYEVGWGAEGSTSLKLRSYQITSNPRLNWFVSGDSIEAIIACRIDGQSLEVNFGELIGTRINALFTDERQINFSPTYRDLLLTSSGQSRAVAISVERALKEAFDWKIGFRQKTSAGDLVLWKNGTKIGESGSSSSNLTGVGIEGAKSLPGRFRWRGAIDYHRLTGSLNGWISDTLPGEFGRVLEDGRYYVGHGSLEGVAISNRLINERGVGKASITLGYGNYNTKLILRDRAPESETIRINDLNIEGFDMIWGTIGLEARIQRFRLTGSISQAVLLHSKFHGTPPTGISSDISGGWILSSGLTYIL